MCRQAPPWRRPLVRPGGSGDGGPVGGGGGDGGPPPGWRPGGVCRRWPGAASLSWTTSCSRGVWGSGPCRVATVRLSEDQELD